jgi:ATP-dependent DNA helicase DinG
MDETIFSSSMISFLLKILFWSIETPDGELDALDYYGEEYFFLSQIHAGAFPIFDEAHRYKHLEFALRARKRAKSANIVICNNHILFQDIISDGSLLGGVKNLILDEAHSLEDVVTQSLKKTISFSSFQNIMQVIEKKILKYKLDAPDFTLVRQNILYDVAELISLLESKLFDNFSVEAKHKMLLLEHSFFAEHLSLMLLSEKIIKSLEILQKYLEVLQDEKISYFSGDIQEISFLKLVLTEAFVANDTSKNIHFLSYDEQKGTQFSLTVLRPGDFLREHLWSKLESVVLTSATLQMQESFQYIQDTLKIHDFDTLVLPSDFDYAKQALVYIPQDLGSVKNNNTQIIAFLQSFFQVVGGKTLLLCTAFSMIREVYTNLKLSLEEKNIELLAQSL